MKRSLSAIALIAALLLTAGCASGVSETGQALSVEQSEELAQARFQLLAEGDYQATVSVGATDDPERLVGNLTVDPTKQVAWGTVARGPEGLAVEANVVMSLERYATDTSGEWVTSEWSAGGLSALAVVFSLATDRPENSQLLRQSDAQYLGSEDGLDVYRLPSTDGVSATTRLWLEDGKLVRLDDGGEGLVITVDREVETAPIPAELAELIGVAD